MSSNSDYHWESGTRHVNPHSSLGIGRFAQNEEVTDSNCRRQRQRRGPDGLGLCARVIGILQAI